MLNWFLSTSVLIAVILLIRRLLRDKIDPRLTYALWLLVALRICIPVSLFTAPVSVSGLAEDSGLTEAVEEVRQVVSPKEVLTTSIPMDSDLTMEELEESWSASHALRVYEVRPYTEEELAEIRRETPGFYQNTDSLPLRMTVERLVGRLPFWNWVYLAGCFVTLVVLNRVDRNFHKRVKKYRKPYEGVLPVDCPIPVYVMSSLPSPCLYLMNRPAIYLNDAALKSGHLDHILTHEIVHHRHRDHWWAVVRCVCLAVQWFNPLVWLAAYLSRQDCELACDASVIKRLGEEQRLSYGKTLVDMIASARTPGAMLQTATTMVSGKKGIAHRVQLIVKRPKMTAVTLIAVLLIAALAVGCTFGGAEDAEVPNDPPGASDSIQEPEPPVSDPPSVPTSEPSSSLPADLSAADLAQSVYSAIVGDDASRDFYMVVYDDRPGHGNNTTHIHMTGENSWNLPESIGKYEFPNPTGASRYEWAYASPDGWDANYGISLSSADGETWLYCWEGTDRVRLHVNGQDYFLTAAVPEGHSSASTLFNVLLWTADDALVHEAHNIVIDGSFSDYSMVVEEYARQFAANLNNLPLWAPSKPENTEYRYSSVSQAYFGEGTENFCAAFGLYFSPEMGMSDWQAGSGMDEETEGEYAGWWKWGVGADFARNSDGDWVCTGTYTGGESLTFPTRLEESSLEQLVYYFYHTTPGHNHDYLIPYYICLQPVSALDELNRLLGEASVPHELCAALGAFLRDYGSYEDIQLTYEVLSNGLASKFRPSLDEGYTGSPE